MGRLSDAERAAREARTPTGEVWEGDALGRAGALAVRAIFTEAADDADAATAALEVAVEGAEAEIEAVTGRSIGSMLVSLVSRRSPRREPGAGSPVDSPRDTPRDTPAAGRTTSSPLATTTTTPIIGRDAAAAMSAAAPRPVAATPPRTPLTASALARRTSGLCMEHTEALPPAVAPTPPPPPQGSDEAVLMWRLRVAEARLYLALVQLRMGSFVTGGVNLARAGRAYSSLEADVEACVAKATARLDAAGRAAVAASGAAEAVAGAEAETEAARDAERHALMLQAGLDFGLGIFWFVPSLLPSSFHWLAASLGFPARRSDALARLARAAQSRVLTAASGWAALVLLWAQAFHSNDLRGAASTLTVALARTPSAPVVCLLGGYMLRREGHVAEAQLLFRALHSAAGRDEGMESLRTIALYEMGWCHMLRLEWAAAAVLFRAFLDRHRARTYKGWCAYQLGCCYYAMGDYARAREAFALAPAHQRPHFSYDAYATRKAQQYLSQPAAAGGRGFSPVEFECFVAYTAARGGDMREALLRLRRVQPLVLSLAEARAARGSDKRLAGVLPWGSTGASHGGVAVTGPHAVALDFPGVVFEGVELSAPGGCTGGAAVSPVEGAGVGAEATGAAAGGGGGSADTGVPGLSTPSIPCGAAGPADGGDDGVDDIAYFFLVKGRVLSMALTRLLAAQPSTPATEAICNPQAPVPMEELQALLGVAGGGPADAASASASAAAEDPGHSGGSGGSGDATGSDASASVDAAAAAYPDAVLSALVAGRVPVDLKAMRMHGAPEDVYGRVAALPNRHDCKALGTAAFACLQCVVALSGQDGRHLAAEKWLLPHALFMSAALHTGLVAREGRGPAQATAPAASTATSTATAPEAVGESDAGGGAGSGAGSPPSAASVGPAAAAEACWCGLVDERDGSPDSTGSRGSRGSHRSTGSGGSWRSWRSRDRKVPRGCPLCDVAAAVTYLDAADAAVTAMGGCDFDKPLQRKVVATRDRLLALPPKRTSSRGRLADRLEGGLRGR